MRNAAGIAFVVLGIAAGCGGGGAKPVDLSVARRVDVGTTGNAYGNAGGVALDGRWAWASKPNESELLKIDRASGRIVLRLHICRGANDVAVGAGAVYAACEATEEVLRLDPATGRVTGRAKVGVKALGLAVTGAAIWVTNREFDDLVRVDPTTLEVVERIDTGRGAWDVAAVPGAVWVTTQGLELVRIDPATNKVAERIPTATKDVSLSLGWVAADDDDVWLTNPDVVARLDPDTGEFTDVIQLGARGATHVQILEGRVWVATARELVLVDASSRTVSGRVTVTQGGAAGLRGIAVAREGAWVLDPDDGDVVAVAARA